VSETIGARPMLYGDKSRQSNYTQTSCSSDEMSAMTRASGPLDQPVRETTKPQRRQQSARPVEMI
jgi:hypothetical protein